MAACLHLCEKLPMSDIEKNVAFWCALIGAVWLAVALAGWRSGRIWAGSLGFRLFRPLRTENPLAFYACFFFFLIGGTALLLFAVALLTGFRSLSG
jgi:hypothetical protein